jgi:asparagine synthase (glutamine-hydrolysing)
VCGICGCFQDPRLGSVDDRVVTGMTDAIAHRGPDDGGEWIDKATGLMLGHRRLAILDLSPAGHQPMKSQDDRFVLSYNGEIYNHLALREQLAASGATFDWRGHSDTETLLACIQEWGVERALKMSVGMFAFGLWDRQLGELTLARDRMGEKPLYYGWQGDSFMFASELQALRAHPAFLGEVDRGALALYLRHGTVPAPYSIFLGISKLEPGTLVTLRLVPGASRELAPRSYWTLDSAIQNGIEHPFDGDASDAVDELERVLTTSVRAQMLSDVPLGAFLSGGVDSSTIVALMQRHSMERVQTFTIGFEEEAYNEAGHAEAVARHLGTDHTEIIVKPADALAVIPSLAGIYSEPFADSSQIPTFLVSRLAAQSVRVSLSGDAGDELFGGYNRYLQAKRTWERADRVPASLRRAAAATLRSVSPRAWDRLYGFASPVLPKGFRMANPGGKAHKLAGVLQSADGPAFYRGLTSYWEAPEDVVIGGKEPPTLLTQPARWPQTGSLESWMMAIDTQTYLPDDILTKVDRAAMANSLETRVPMLDHRVVEFAWTLPLEYKIRSGVGKWPLRQVLDRYVPRELIDRPKMGFAIPLESWLRGPLREWAEELLDERRLIAEGFFRAEPIRAMWAEHLSGSRNLQNELWTILMFQSWLEQISDRPEQVSQAVV